MIRFACTGCGRNLNVADALAGKVVGCPACKARVKAPLPEAESVDEDEVDECDELDESDERGPWLNANRIRGMVACAAGIGMLIFALTFSKFKNPGDWAFGEYGTPVCCTLAVVLFSAGVLYLIRG